MKRKLHIMIGICIMFTPFVQADRMGSAFTYQGYLLEQGNPADGSYDLLCRLYNAAEGGYQVGPSQLLSEQPVSSGYFNAKLDFGVEVFKGHQLWLDIAVRPSGGSSSDDFTELADRILLTYTPYALQTRGIFVDTDFNVGIGTTSPSGRLHVDGGQAEVDSDGRPIILKAQDGGNAQSSSMGGAGGDILLLPGAGGAGNFEGPSGKVGIGTNNPQARLDVRGDLIVDNRIRAHDSDGLELAIANGSTRLYIPDTGHVGIGGMTPSYPFHVKTWFEDSWITGIHNMSTAANAHGLIVRAEGGNPLLLQSGDGDVLMVSQNGNVGIGTSEPDDLLHVWRDTKGSPGISITNADSGGGHYALRVGGSTSSVGAGNLAIFDHLANATRMVVNRDGEVGIGTTSPICTLHVGNDILYQAPTGAERIPRPHHHTALIEHTYTGDLLHNDPLAMANVLALKVRHSDETPSSLTHFITFYDKFDNILGSIIGTGHGGVELLTYSGDFAECLPHLKENETFEPGDIVGILAGRITRDTQQAHRVMVISTAPVISGNHPRHPSQMCRYEKVAFLGQTPVKVRGPVRAGDYIVPSGKADGTGIAVAARNLTLEQCHQIVGQAWENANDIQMKKVNCMIGGQTVSASSERLVSLLQSQQREIVDLKRQIAQLAAVTETLIQQTVSGSRWARSE